MQAQQTAAAVFKSHDEAGPLAAAPFTSCPSALLQVYWLRQGGPGGSQKAGGGSHSSALLQPSLSGRACSGHDAVPEQVGPDIHNPELLL